MKKVIWILLSFVPLLANAQLRHWRFEQVDSLLAAEERPLLVFVHTDWCRYCQTMKQTTLQDSAVISLLNERFYFLSLNAETTASIRFRDYDFAFQPSGRGSGIHALALALAATEEGLAYPTLCVLNPQYEIILQYPAYLNAEALRNLLESL